jgi:hypothetical protein
VREEEVGVGWEEERREVGEKRRGGECAGRWRWMVFEVSGGGAGARRGSWKAIVSVMAGWCWLLGNGGLGVMAGTARPLVEKRIGYGRRKKIHGAERENLGKPYVPPVSGTEPRSACVGAILGRPVNAAAAWVFSFFVICFLVFSFYCFFHCFSFPFLFFVLFLS